MARSPAVEHGDQAVTDPGPTGGRPPTRPDLHPLLRLVGGTLAFLVCLIGCATELSALGRPHTAPTALLVAAAVGFGIGTVVLARIAIRAQRQSATATAEVVAARRAATPAARRRAKPMSPRVRRAASAGLLVGVVALIVFLGVSLHAGTAKSSETQHHGIARRGRVTAVRTEHHDTRYDSWLTFSYVVHLDAPADGTSVTLVHDPHHDYQRQFVGDRVDVRIDPHDLGYAELPGHPVGSSTWYVPSAALGGAVLLVLIPLAIQSRKRRAEARAAAAPAITTA
jgi:hypothetical protein